MGECYARPFAHPPTGIEWANRASPGESGESERSPLLARIFHCESYSCFLTVAACLRRRVATYRPRIGQVITLDPFCARQCAQGRALASETAGTVEDKG